MDKVLIGKNIKFLKKENKVTSKVLANELGITTEQLKAIENGTKGTKEIYEKIAEVFNVEIEDILYKDLTNIAKLHEDEITPSSQKKKLPDDIVKVRIKMVKPTFSITCISAILLVGIMNLFFHYIKLSNFLWFVIAAPIVTFIIFMADYYDSKDEFKEYKMVDKNNVIIAKYMNSFKYKKVYLVLCLAISIVLIINSVLSLIFLKQYSLDFVLSIVIIVISFGFVYVSYTKSKSLFTNEKEYKVLEKETQGNIEKLICTLSMLVSYIGFYYLIEMNASIEIYLVFVIISVLLIGLSLALVHLINKITFQYELFEENKEEMIKIEK